MVSATAGWLFMIGGSALIGGVCALMSKKYQALILSASIPWVVFLVLNFYFEYHSADREIMQGSWVFFQIAIGTISAITGLLTALWVFKRRERRSNPLLNTDARQETPRAG
jgi:membrane protein DedA with SNARE-associated domain